jgi:hypothetical protein
MNRLELAGRKGLHPGARAYRYYEVETQPIVCGADSSNR